MSAMAYASLSEAAKVALDGEDICIRPGRPRARFTLTAVFQRSVSLVGDGGIISFETVESSLPGL